MGEDAEHVGLEQGGAGDERPGAAVVWARAVDAANEAIRNPSARFRAGRADGDMEEP
jgi:hypothetical protein